MENTNTTPTTTDSFDLTAAVKDYALPVVVGAVAIYGVYKLGSFIYKKCKSDKKD